MTDGMWYEIEAYKDRHEWTVYIHPDGIILDAKLDD